MSEQIRFQLRASVVPFQLLRPLPTIFACVSGAHYESKIKELPPPVRKEFDSHLDCLKKTIGTISEMIEPTKSECADILEKVKGLSEAEVGSLCERTNLLNSCLQRMCEDHKTAVKEECRAHPFVFRDIYRSTIDVKKLGLIYQGEVTERISSLEESLSKKCYYDVEMRSEESLASNPINTDFVLFAPTQTPGWVYFDGIPKSGIPMLLMVDLGKNLEECGIANLRRVFMREHDGINVLYSPFSPIRLFQEVDTRYIRHLYLKEIKRPL